MSRLWVMCDLMHLVRRKGLDVLCANRKSFGRAALMLHVLQVVAVINS